MHDDIIVDIFERIGSALPAPVRAELERSIRRDWGGDRPYIARSGESGKASLSQRNASIARDYHQGESIALLERRYGVSRRRIYQVLSLTPLQIPTDIEVDQ